MVDHLDFFLHIQQTVDFEKQYFCKLYKGTFHLVWSKIDFQYIKEVIKELTMIFFKPLCKMGPQGCPNGGG